MLRPATQNEPDRDKRQRLEEERIRLLDEHLNPIYLDAARIDREAVRQLGRGQLLRAVQGLRLQARRARRRVPRGARRDGAAVGARGRPALPRPARDRPHEARPWDVGRLFRAPELDSLYPQDRMLPALESTLSDLGIDLSSQRNVELDLEPRPQKVPRPFCMPIEVPDRVILMMQPVGGRDDWEALFHEAVTPSTSPTRAATCRWRRSASATWR
jgi:hypothetical protein